MFGRLFQIVPLLLVSKPAFADPQAGPPRLRDGVVVGPGKLNTQTIGPNLDLLAIEVARLSKELKATQAQLAATEAELTEHKKDFTFLTVMVNGINKRLLMHKHPYTYASVKYWNKQFVTSGRPIVEHEKRAFGSFIEGVPSQSGMTGSPDLATE